jgi:tropomyosin
LREEVNKANETAEGHAQRVKELEQRCTDQEHEMFSLQNKISQQDEELDKAQEEIESHKQLKPEMDELKKEYEASLRKCTLLEQELENAEKQMRETTKK